MKPRVLILDGSLGGESGNTAAILDTLAVELEKKAFVDVVHLADLSEIHALLPLLRAADGFVFASGTYWDSWGSPLQKFLEEMTHHEASDLWLGKPAAVVVTMHSVGGKEVLSRLQGVLCTLGMLIPPMSGMTYSLAVHLALAGASSEFHADLWQLKDLQVVGANLLAACSLPKVWKTWPIDSGDAGRRWYDHSGA